MRYRATSKEARLRSRLFSTTPLASFLGSLPLLSQEGIFAGAGGYISLRITRTAAATLFLFLLLSASAVAQTVSYTIAMPQPSSHTFRVEMTIDQPGMPSVELSLPSWNGLYQVRDFGQYVQNLRANVPVKRTDKDTWRFTTAGTQQLKVSYAVYANEPGAFSSELTETHAFFNSADLLLFWEARRELSVTLTISPPEGWNVASSLPAGGKPFTYQADNYDHLADCPVDAGKFD